MNKIIPDFRIFLILAILSLALFLLDTFNFLRFPKRLTFYISNPISFGLFTTSKNIGRQFYFVFGVRFAAQENSALKLQVGQLLSENAKLRKSLAETQSLLSQERRLDPQSYNLLIARPIGLSRYLKIDKGLMDGVAIGEAVVFNENLIGKVISISENAANVQLLSDPDAKVAAFSQGLEGKAKGILLGQFGTDIIFDKILHEEKISIGDLVYSEGTEDFLPRGLVLGKVTSIIDSQNQLFKQAKIASIFDVSDLDLVFVIKE